MHRALSKNSWNPLFDCVFVYSILLFSRAFKKPLIFKWLLESSSKSYQEASLAQFCIQCIVIYHSTFHLRSPASHELLLSLSQVSDLFSVQRGYPFASHASSWETLLVESRNPHHLSACLFASTGHCLIDWFVCLVVFTKIEFTGACDTLVEDRTEEQLDTFIIPIAYLISSRDWAKRPFLKLFLKRMSRMLIPCSPFLPIQFMMKLLTH